MNIKDEDIEFLKKQRELFERKRKLLIDPETLDIEYDYDSSDMDQYAKDTEYYKDLSNAIYNIDEFLFKHSSFIRKKIIKDINKTKKSIQEFNELLDSKRPNYYILDNMIPYLEGKLSYYISERSKLCDKDGVWYNEDGNYEYGLLNDNDLEFYETLTEIIQMVRDFILEHQDLDRECIRKSIDKVNSLILHYD